MPSQISWYPFGFRVLNKIHGEIKMKKYNDSETSGVLMILEVLYCPF